MGARVAAYVSSVPSGRWIYWVGADDGTIYAGGIRDDRDQAVAGVAARMSAAISWIGSGTAARVHRRRHLRIVGKSTLGEWS